MRTGSGDYIKDPSGLWHYHFDSKRGSDAFDAALDAVNSKPQGPAWFWFNGTPAPISANDDDDALLSRWREWKGKWNSSPEALRLMHQYAGRP